MGKEQLPDPSVDTPKEWTVGATSKLYTYKPTAWTDFPQKAQQQHPSISMAAMLTMAAFRNMILAVLLVFSIYIIIAVVRKLNLAYQAISEGVELVATGATFVTGWAAFAWFVDATYSTLKWGSIFMPMLGSCFSPELAVQDVASSTSPLQLLIASSMEYKILGGTTAAIMSLFTCGRR